MQTALWWIKKDFRLKDNPALTVALEEAAAVVPVFLFEPALLEAEETSAFHVAAWCEALADLRARLVVEGGEVLVLHGEAVESFARLHAAVGFEAIFSHEEIGSSVTYERDKAVARWCRETGVTWSEHRQTGVFRGRLDRDRRSRRWKAFMAESVLPAPETADLARLRVPESALGLQPPRASAPTPEAFGHPLGEAQAAQRQPVSETAAEDTLESFLGDRGRCYSGGISSPNDAIVCGSRLSVHLAWGTITGRAVYAATEARQEELRDDGSDEAKQWRKSLRAFKSRLHWRDHFIQRLESEPDMEFAPLNLAYAELPTPGDDLFDLWYEGRTGWPLVDACLRCAHATGFLNFRMRAFITSVAVHSLRIGWRKILHPMARLWADYEPGIHIAQTQMQAGVVGINQLRIYSPDKQLADHDADAVFVHRWVPELREIPAERIHRHPAEPLPGYPLPLVDWRATSSAMREAYFEIKRRPETRALAEKVYERHGSRKPPRSRRRAGGRRSSGER